MGSENSKKIDVEHIFNNGEATTVSYLALTKKTKNIFTIENIYELNDDGKACTARLSIEKAPKKPIVDNTNSAKNVQKTAPSATPKETPKPPEKPFIERVLDLRDQYVAGKNKTLNDVRRFIRQVEPFELSDMPIALKACNWPVAEKLSRRWFNGRYYIGPVDTNAHGGKEDGIYDSDMVDDDTVTLNWLFTYKYVKDDYEELLTTLQTKKAIEILHHGVYGDGGFKKFFLKNPNFNGELDTWSYVKNDIQQLHKQFQYQMKDVTQFHAMDWDNYFMSDLIGSLGNFYFYAAVAKAKIKNSINEVLDYAKKSMTHIRKITVEITHVYIYAKDTYTFSDDGKVSQYLGHWNKNGMILEPYALSAEMSSRYSSKAVNGSSNLINKIFEKLHIKHSKLPTNAKTELFEGGNEAASSLPIQIANHVSLLPIDTANKLLSDDIYYPVRNRDYNEWREKHHKGGDLIVFSNKQLVPLKEPIILKFEY